MTLTNSSAKEKTLPLAEPNLCTATFLRELLRWPDRLLPAPLLLFSFAPFPRHGPDEQDAPSIVPLRRPRGEIGPPSAVAGDFLLAFTKDRLGQHTEDLTAIREFYLADA